MSGSAGGCQGSTGANEGAGGSGGDGEAPGFHRKFPVELGKRRGKRVCVSVSVCQGERRTGTGFRGQDLHELPPQSAAGHVLVSLELGGEPGNKSRCTIFPYL